MDEDKKLKHNFDKIGKDLNDIDGDLNKINVTLRKLDDAGVKIDFSEVATKSIEKILNVIADLDAKGEDNYFEAGTVNLGKGAKVDYKFGIKIGAEPSTKEKPVEKKPLVQVFKEDDKVRITAEFPGVKENEIELSLKDNELVLRIKTEGFESKIGLPENMKLIEKRFKNNVLELVLEKQF